MVNATTDNVIQVYREATPEQVAEGLAWYDEAHSLAQDFAETYGITLEVAAGVIAALSPMNSWGVNKNLAAKFLEAGGLDKGYLSTGLSKARQILAGGDIEPILFGTRGSKVLAFYHGILTAGQTESVCIDRHAYDIVVNHRHSDTHDPRPSVTGKRYAEAAEKYREAAARLGTMSAAQVQAVTWVTWRDKYWAKGAFNGS